MEIGIHLQVESSGTSSIPRWSISLALWLYKRRRRGSPHLQIAGTPNQDQFIKSSTKVFETAGRETWVYLCSLQGLHAWTGSGGQTNMFLLFLSAGPQNIAHGGLWVGGEIQSCDSLSAFILSRPSEIFFFFCWSDLFCLRFEVPLMEGKLLPGDRISQG